MTTVSLPVSLVEIGGEAFENCTNIRDIFCVSATPVKISSDTFSKATQKEAIVHVKKGMAKNYQLHKQWGKFLNIVSME